MIEMAEKLKRTEVHNRIGRPSKPVVMILDSKEIYFDSIKEAAQSLLQIKGLERSITNITNRISLSCTIRGRKVYGVQFRFPTDDELEKGNV